MIEASALAALFLGIFILTVFAISFAGVDSGTRPQAR